MAYNIIHDRKEQRARWTIEDGKVSEEGRQVGIERDGIVYWMSGEVWGVLKDLNSPASPPISLDLSREDPAP